MYARLRKASTTPSVCLLCTLALPARTSSVSYRRRYANQAVLPVQDPDHATTSKSQETDSFPKASSSKKGKSKDFAGNSTTKAAEATIRAARRAFQDAENAERRRRVLTTLGKSSKFAIAGMTTPQEPTLQDLYNLKPTSPPLIPLDFVYPNSSLPFDPASPKPSTVEEYNAEFQKLVELLAAKFQKRQLTLLYKEGRDQLPDEIKVKTRRPLKSMSVQDVATEIIRWLWHWPYAAEVEARRVYLTMKLQREFPLSTHEFFLLLGPDGTSLRTLTQSYGIVIRKVKRTKNAFSLVLEGLSYSLDHFGIYLVEQQKRIRSVHVHLEDKEDTPNETSMLYGALRPELVQRISKLTNALVEDNGDGTFQISAHHREHIAMAQRLVTRASRQAKLPHPSFLANLPPSIDSLSGEELPSTYALFPFELSNPESLPFRWTSSALLARFAERVASQSYDPRTTGTPYLYRAREVSDGLENGLISVMRRTNGLKEELSQLIDAPGEPRTLRKALGLPDKWPLNVDNIQQIQVTVSLGHIVFAPGTNDQTLLPPLPGSWMFPQFSDWLKNDAGTVTFVPEAPSYLMSSSPTSQTTLTRLVYRSSPLITEEAVSMTGSQRALPTLKFEFNLLQDVERRDVERSSPETSDEISTTDRGGWMHHEDEQSDMLFQQHILHHSPSSSSAPTTTFDSSSPLVQIWKGHEMFVNVMLPHRPVDIQLSSFHPANIPLEAAPLELQEFATTLSQHMKVSPLGVRPPPPLHVTFEGARYVLDLNATVQTSSYVLSGNSSAELPFTMEKTMDSESKESAGTCSIVCSDPNTTTAWHRFLEDCDRLTWLRTNRADTVAFDSFSTDPSDSIPNSTFD